MFLNILVSCFRDKKTFFHFCVKKHPLNWPQKKKFPLWCRGSKFCDNFFSIDSNSSWSETQKKHMVHCFSTSERFQKRSENFRKFSEISCSQKFPGNFRDFTPVFWARKKFSSV